MLHLLGDYLSDATSIIGEVENPDFEENADEKVLQTRRKDFYFRNGFRDTEARVECFGVPFIIIETGKNLMHSKKQVEQLYKMHYSKVLPKDLFEKNIVITGE